MVFDQDFEVIFQLGTFGGIRGKQKQAEILFSRQEIDRQIAERVLFQKQKNVQTGHVIDRRFVHTKIKEPRLRVNQEVSEVQYEKRQVLLCRREIGEQLL